MFVHQGIQSRQFPVRVITPPSDQFRNAAGFKHGQRVGHRVRANIKNLRDLAVGEVVNRKEYDFRTLLGWNDLVSLEEGIREVTTWVRENLATLKTLPQEYSHKE